LPFFYSLKYRLVKNVSVKNLIIEEYGSYTDAELLKAFDQQISASDKTSDLQNTDKFYQFIRQKIEESGISSDGQCKFCGVFNINLSNFALKKGTSLNKFMHKSIKSNDEYSSIVTSIRLHDEEGKYLKDQNSEKQDDKISITLNKKLLKYFPNLVNLTLKNLKINEIDESINKCIYLKNIEFINNQLKDFPENLFNETTPLLDQIIIDNNPLTSLPYSIFTIDSLKSIVLTRLNIESLPDDWLDKITNEANVTNLRSIHIAQTRLQSLPKDLLVANKQLEQLTFQGVNLILPENENQWSNISADLDTIKNRYCPILLATEEADELFKKFDTDKNNLLDYKELQSFNAYIFKKFPRLEVLADLGSVKREKDSEKLDILASMYKIFEITTLTYLDLSFQAITSIPNGIGGLKNLKCLKLKYCVYLQKLSSRLGLLKLIELDLTGIKVYFF
jgi:Leucine-rich repeat (LRR) protein